MHAFVFLIVWHMFLYTLCCHEAFMQCLPRGSLVGIKTQLVIYIYIYIYTHPILAVSHSVLSAAIEGFPMVSHSYTLNVIRNAPCIGKM
ncbi:hypothetical protein FKM82_028702 [Ascaphus truei]